MPALEAPPPSPQAQAQMAASPHPNFGPGMAQAQQHMEKSPEEVAVATVEKILMGVQDETFQTYAKRAVAILKVGLAMTQKKGPESQQTQMGPGGTPPAPHVPGPPVPGPMPG